MRITKTDVEMMFSRLVAQANKQGYDTEGWTLHKGSKANGIAYRVRDAEGYEPLGMALGMTASEAYWALTMADNTLWYSHNMWQRRS